MSYRDYSYREIITKAVCGKGRKLTKATNYVDPSNRPSSVLGCWIINHAYHAKEKDKECIEIHGTYDINIWYSFNDNTKTEVVSHTVQYCDEIILSSKDDQCFGNEYDVIAKVIQQPNCLKCNIDGKGNKIAVEVEREFVVKLIGETKVNVKVEPVQPIGYEQHQHHYPTSKSDKFIKGK